MGVLGLWKLLEPCGRSVPPESLQGQTVGVDVSIWLNQAMKGYRDSRGQPLPNAHLLCVFSRVCKLLTYRVRPVFVFDGGVPALKRDTLAARRLRKQAATTSADRATSGVLHNLIRQEALRAVLGEDAPLPHATGTATADLFQLPVRAQENRDASASSSDSEADAILDRLCDGEDVHSFDFDSAEFRTLSSQVKHDILTELRATRKQNSWGRISEMPDASDDFSDFQMARLLKRKKFQDTMDAVETEITKRNMEVLDLGVGLAETISAQRMASKSGTFLVLGKLKSSDPAAPVDPDDVDDPVKEELLTKAADEAEYLSGADLFGGGNARGSSAAAVDAEMEDLKELACENGGLSQQEMMTVIRNSSGQTTDEDVSRNAVDEETVRKFSEMGKKYSNLYLRFSAQRLLSENKKPKSPHKSPRRKSLSEITASTKSPASPVNISELSLQLPKFANPAQMKLKGSTYSSIAQLSVTEDKLSGQVETASSEAGSLQITIDPSKFRPQDDLFADVFISDDDSNDSGASNSASAVSESVPVSASQTSIDVSRSTVCLPVHSKKQSTKRTLSEVTVNDHCHQSNSVTPKLQQTDVQKSANPTSGLRTKPVVEAQPSQPSYGSCVGTDTSSNAVDGKLDTLGSAADPTSGYDSLDSAVPPDSDKVNRLSRTDSFSPHHIDTVLNACGTTDSVKGASLDFSLERYSDEDPLGNESHEADETAFPSSPPVRLPDDGDMAASSDRVWPELQSDDGVSDRQLCEMASDVAADQLQLLKERGRQERLAASVTEQMYLEIQSMLQLFGIPFIVSPMEAEAQCAFLEQAGLTDASITDDSDVWLFGGRQVYRNFFNQRRHVERYRAEDIAARLGLQRQHLVAIALLTGSDYTPGVETVGCVRALEILSEFPGEGVEGLQRFRRWREAGEHTSPSPLRRSLSRLHLPAGFPSEAVVSAYLQPQVDDSREPFSWAEPDWPGLRYMAAEKLGWSRDHTDQLLEPVLKRMQQPGGQTRLDQFFQPVFHNPDVAPHETSQRLRKAVERIRDGPSESPLTPPRSGKRRRRAPTAEDTVDVDELMDDGLDDLLAGVDTDLTGVETSRSTQTGQRSSAQVPRAVDPRVSGGSAGRGGKRGGTRRNPSRALIASLAASPTSIPSNVGSADDSARDSFAPSGNSPGAHNSRARSAVCADSLESLTTEDRERVTLVRKLRVRADRVRAELRLEGIGTSPASAVPGTSTSQVRERMYRQLLKGNPRLQEDRLRRVAQSCRNPTRTNTPSTSVNTGTNTPSTSVNTGTNTPSTSVNTGTNTPSTSVNTGTNTPSTSVNTRTDTHALSSSAHMDTGAHRLSASVCTDSSTDMQFVCADTGTDALSSFVGTDTDNGVSDRCTAGVEAHTSRSDAVNTLLVADNKTGSSNKTRANVGSTSATANNPGGSQQRSSPAKHLPVVGSNEEIPQRLQDERRKLEARRRAAQLFKGKSAAADNNRRRTNKHPTNSKHVALRRKPTLSESSDSG